MCKMKITAVTSRRLCPDFFKRLKELSELGIPTVLREKDLGEAEYFELCKKAAEISDTIIPHTYISAARELSIKKIHLPLHILETADVSGFDTVGASVHSPGEAKKAEALGATYIIAGHVFETDCKRGAPPRGLDFLKAVCGAVNLPVFAIGGISPQNAPSVINAGAAGVCVMSSFMKAESAAELYKQFMI